MYSVMLVDDDFPVLELLSEAVDWEGLGLRLCGTHENGLAAWEQAQWEMPDILITDIGMPKMDGLELIARIRAHRNDVCVAILSCHNEFQYAQQAMRLNVQDYLLKDAFNPNDLELLLSRFKHQLDEKRKTNWQQHQLQHMLDRTKDMQKEQWLKNFIQQPLLSPRQWLLEANAQGLFQGGEACLPVIGYIEGYSEAKQLFISDQTLRFAVNNIMEEVLLDLQLRGLYIGYGEKVSLLLFSYLPSLKQSVYDQAAVCLRQIQSVLRSAIKLGMSFIIGESCASPEGLKIGLNALLECGDQRFYLEQGGIVKKQAVDTTQSDLFSYYEPASTELRELLIGKKSEAVSAFADKWISLIGQHRYPSETVRDWVLKLLIDQKLKLHSMQIIRPGDTADKLHKAIGEADSLAQLKLWLIRYLQTLASMTAAGAGIRQEVVEACQYVGMHLHRRISLEEVAEHLFLNSSYFSRLFKKETGENFIEYVTRMKIGKAKEMLDQTGDSVGKICETLGYDNQSYFIKIFKAHTGLTPVEYRG